MALVECNRHPIHRPIMPMTVTLMAGIAAGSWRPGWFWTIFVLTLVLLVYVWRRISMDCLAVVLPLAAGVCVGYLSIQPWLAPDLPDHHISRYVDRGYWQIQGVVSQPAKVNPGRWKVLISAQTVKNEDGIHEAVGHLQVTGRGPWPGANVGDKVAFRGRLRSIRNFSNPGGFDFRRFMMLKGIRARVYASAKSLKIISTGPSGGMIQRTDHLRTTLGGRMASVLDSHSPDSVNLLKALILGDRSAISSSLRSHCNRVGVGHVLAISGLHVGMVATLSFLAARWILAIIPALIKRAWVDKAAALVSLGPVLGYGLLAGLSPSTQRAMLMVSVFLMGLWVGRRHDWFNTLALAALVILVVYPPALFSVSFQLSFSAVVAIIAGVGCMPGPDPKGNTDFWEKACHRLKGFLWVSGFAILGTLPLVLHRFNQVSLVGLAANLVVVPVVGFVVVPAGLLGTLGNLVHPGLGDFLWQIAAWGVDWMLWIVRIGSGWPWAAVHSVTPTGLEVVLYYCLGAVVLFWKHWPRRTLTLTVLLVIVALDVGYWGYQRYGRHDMRVTAIDVGQAGANLIELPGGYTILVDGGGYSDNRIFDTGAAVIAPLLWRKKIRTVDLVVLSHPNSDHLNGLFFILEHFTVREVWSNHEPADTRGYERWTDLLVDRGIAHTDFQQLPRRVIRNGVDLQILAPPADFLERKQTVDWRDANNNSLVLRACYGDISFLFSGDIEKPAENELVEQEGTAGLESTVLMVPHHGSRSSTSRVFLKAVNPREAIISAGWQNRFKFPHDRVLQRLERHGCTVWCTAEAGAVEVTTDGDVYSIRTFGSR